MVSLPEFFSFRNSTCVFITLKIYLRVFDKTVALKFVMCLRVGVLGIKKLSPLSTENHSRKTSVGKPHMNTQRFHDLQFHLSLSDSILRVVTYCTFRSRNNTFAFSFMGNVFRLMSLLPLVSSSGTCSNDS